LVIRHNFIHDVIGRGRVKGQWRAPYYAWGIYLDWSSSGTRTYGNIIARAPRGGIHLHDGRDNVIENNIIVDCGQQQIELNGWTVDHFFWKRGMERFGWTKQYDAVADQPAWHCDGSTLRDPRTAALLDGRTMHHNTVRRNILVPPPPGTEAKAIRYRNASLEDNPSDHNLIWQGGHPIRTGHFAVKEIRGPDLVANGGFEEGGQDDYRLRPESPAFGLGFEPIPVKKIGCYADVWRASWPIKEPAVSDNIRSTQKEK
jgi:parallel beta-helix repeat protein